MMGQCSFLSCIPEPLRWGSWPWGTLSSSGRDFVCFTLPFLKDVFLSYLCALENSTQKLPRRKRRRLSLFKSLLLALKSHSPGIRFPPLLLAAASLCHLSPTWLAYPQQVRSGLATSQMRTAPTLGASCPPAVVLQNLHGLFPLTFTMPVRWVLLLLLAFWGWDSQGPQEVKLLTQGYPARKWPGSKGARSRLSYSRAPAC